MRRNRLLLAVLSALLGLGAPVGGPVRADEPKSPAPGPVEEIDLDRAVDALRYLFADPAWRVSTTGVPVPDARPTGASPAPARRWEIPGAGVDSRAVSAWVVGGSQVACLWLTLYETETAARDAVDTRARLAKRDRVDMRVVATDDFEVGAGPGGELPGYTTHLVTVQQDTKSVLDVHAVAIGRMTLELSLRDAPEIDRAAQDAAISRLATLLRDPKAKADVPAPKPPVLGTGTRPLTILVTDGEGHPVPRALATVGWVRMPVTSGKVETHLPKVPSRVDVWAAADENGTPLPLAPVFDVELGADQERLEIHLPAGATIDGRVLDADATPLAGLTVEALPRGTHREEPRAGDPSVLVHARATSDDAGRFHLVGLAKVPYVLFLLDGRTVVSSGPDRCHGRRRRRRAPARAGP